MKVGLRPPLWLIGFTISFALTIAIYYTAVRSQETLPQQANEAHVIGMGIDDFVTVPDSGETLTSFLGRVPLPSSVTALQIIVPNGYPDFTIKLGSSPLDRPPWNERLFIQPGGEIWLLGKAGTPFPVAAINDLRMAPAE